MLRVKVLGGQVALDVQPDCRGQRFVPEVIPPRRRGGDVESVMKLTNRDPKMLLVLREIAERYPLSSGIDAPPR